MTFYHLIYLFSFSFTDLLDAEHEPPAVVFPDCYIARCKCYLRQETICKAPPVSMCIVMFRLGLLDEAVEDAMTAVNLNQVFVNTFVSILKKIEKFDLFTIQI